MREGLDAGPDPGSGSSAGGLRSAWSVVWRSLVFFLVWGVLTAPFFVPMTARLRRWEQDAPIQARLYADIAGAATVLLASWVMIRLVDRRPFATLGLGTARLRRDLPLGLVLGTAWLGGSLGLAAAAGRLVPAAPARMSGTFLLGSGVALAFNVVTQQLLLGGYVFQTLRARTRPAVAILVSAALFAGYHAGAFRGAWLPAVNVFAAGVLFCGARALTDGLWLPIGIHLAWNYLLGPVLGLTVSGSGHLGGGWHVLTLPGPALLTGGTFGLEGGLIVTVTTVLGIGSLALAGRRRPPRPKRLPASHR